MKKTALLIFVLFLAGTVSAGMTGSFEFIPADDPIIQLKAYDLKVTYGCNASSNGFVLTNIKLYNVQGDGSESPVANFIPCSYDVLDPTDSCGPCIQTVPFTTSTPFSFNLRLRGYKAITGEVHEYMSPEISVQPAVGGGGGGGLGGSGALGTTAPMTTTTTTTTLTPAGQYFLPEQSFRCESVNEGFPGCAHDFSCRFAAEPNPVVRCSGCEDCMAECAKACGSATECLADAADTCEDCCEQNTCGNYAPYDWMGCIIPVGAEAKEVCSCMKSCTGTCDANTEFCNLIELLRIIAGIAAVVLLSIHGLRLIMTTQPEGRKDAKQGILYVIIGTLIILIASGLVSYFYVGELIC